MKTCAQVAILTLLNIFTLTILISTAPLDARIHVPGDVPDLQTALDMADNGEHIVLASGVHLAPVGGFLWNRNSGFTLHIEGEAGGAVLDGQGANPIFVQRMSQFLFRNITFANGFSANDGVAGGLTLGDRASSTLIRCHFDNNQSTAPTRGGGAIVVGNHAAIHLLDSRLTNNRAQVRGGAIEAIDESAVFALNTEFTGNRVDLPLHHPQAAGGAIYGHESAFWATNSSFENNRAGHAGGAIFLFNSWQEETGFRRFIHTLYLANTYFAGNVALADATVPSTSPSRGGAIDVADDTRVAISNSRFVQNEAENGGALSSYRNRIQIEDSIFRENRATGSGSNNGFGGTLWAVSDDLNDATTENGTLNRPSSDITIYRSLMQGTDIGRSARNGGCLHISGDTHRSYGRNGVPAMNDAATNRARLSILESAFDQCDVESEAGVPVSGQGGAMELVHVDLDLQYSLIMRSNAYGSGGTAGGIRLIANTNSLLKNNTFAHNAATQFAGALVFTGGSITIEFDRFYGNGLFTAINSPTGPRPPAIPVVDSKTLFLSPGINVFGTVDERATGTVKNSTFISTGSLVIVEDDRASGPINAVLYDGNEFFGATDVFTNPLTGPLNYSQLNLLTIPRSPPQLGDTVKSYVLNVELGTSPDLGMLLVLPPHRLPATTPAEDPTTPAYLAFAWSGPGPATLNGLPETERSDVRSASSGPHTLQVVTVGTNRTVSDLPPIDLRVRADQYFPYAPNSNVRLIWETNAPFDCALETGDHSCSNSPIISYGVIMESTLLATLQLFGPLGGAWEPVMFTYDPGDVPLEFLVFDDALESNDLTGWSRHVIQP